MCNFCRHLFLCFVAFCSLFRNISIKMEFNDIFFINKKKLYGVVFLPKAIILFLLSIFIFLLNETFFMLFNQCAHFARFKFDTKVFKSLI